MSIIEPKSWEQAILDNRQIYQNLTDQEFIALFSKKHPVTEQQVAAVLTHYKKGAKP